jgi:hypothetical protein
LTTVGARPIVPGLGETLFLALRVLLQLRWVG